MDKFNTHQVTMGIKKSIKQQNSKQKRHIAPKSKEFRSWILRKVIDNGKNNSLNIWILDNPKIWGTHLNRREVVMGGKLRTEYTLDWLQNLPPPNYQTWLSLHAGIHNNLLTFGSDGPLISDTGPPVRGKLTSSVLVYSGTPSVLTDVTGLI